MKKFYIYAFVFGALMSCAKKESFQPLPKNQHAIYDALINNGNKITPKRAVEIAFQYLG